MRSSLINVKFKVQDTTKSVLQKKMRNDTFKCSKFSLYQRQITLRVFKMQKTCNFINFIKESNNSGFYYFFTQKVIFRKYKENWEHLNISLCIFCLTFLLYLEL